MTPSHLTCKHIDLKPLLLWLYVIEATTFFIKSNFIDNIFQVSCVGIMMLILFARFIRLERPRVNLVLLLYVFLIITGCIPDLMSGTVPVGFKIMLSFALPLLMCLFVYNIYSRQEYLPRSLFTIPVWYGVLISIQSIILEIANFAGLPIKVWYEDIEKIGNRASVCSLFEIPMGAYAEWGSLGGKTILRIQGFYIEPSKMAMFFIIPVCFAWGLYKQTSKRRYKWAFIVCSVAFLLTMSRAGYLSMIGAILMALIYSTYKKLKKANDTYRREITTQKDIRKVLFAALLAVVAMALLLSLMVLLSNFFPDLEFLHTGITDSDGKMNLMRSETVDSNIIVDGLLEQPWGVWICKSFTRYCYSSLRHKPSECLYYVAGHRRHRGGIAGAIYHADYYD